MKAYRPQTNPLSSHTFARVLMIGSIALLSLLGTEGIYLLISLSTASSTPQAYSKPAMHAATPTVIASTHSTEVTSLGQRYMDALLQQKYTVMWSMLHPQMQSIWPDQGTFSRYLQTRFENYMLQRFSLGKVSSLSAWTNPETMIQYQNVEIMPISLQLVSRLTPEQRAQLAPQFQQPDQLLQNIPLISLNATNQSNEANNQWLILKGGPADPEAPILPPLTPVSRTLAVPILMYHYVTSVPANDPDPI